MKLKATNNKIDNWPKKWKIKINQSKSTHITLTLCNQTCLTVQMGKVDLHQKNEKKCLGMHLKRTLTWAKFINKKKIAQSKSETNTLATQKINTINRKQTPPIQKGTQTHMDLWNSAMGASIQFQHRNHPELTIQVSPTHSECSLVHKHPLTN
jgi:phage-related protein